MGDSKAHILVTTNVPVKLLDSCSINDTKNNFIIRVNDVIIEPVNIFVNHPGFPEHPGKILIELKNSDVPKKNDKLQVEYINTTPNCDIIHRDVAENIAIPMDDFSFSTESSNIITTTKLEDYPSIVKINSPNEDGGKSIFLFVRDFRNISSSLDLGNFNILINPTPNSVYTNISFTNTATIDNGHLKFTAIEGAIEKGTTYDVSYTGNNIKDHHGLELQTFTTAPVECENSIQNLIFHSGSIDTKAPNKILLRFKNPLTNQLVSVQNNISVPYNNLLKTYKINIKNNEQFIESYSLNNNININALSIRTVIPTDETVRCIEYTSPVVFKYSDNVSVIWDSKKEQKSKCIKDLFDNIVFNSQHDPKAGLNTENSLAINIENNIEGITINPNTSTIKQNVSTFDILLKFTRINNYNEIVPVIDNGLVVNNFKIKNISTTKEFFPDSVLKQGDDILLSVNYNTTNYDKVINVNDNIRIDYLDTNWPSTIKDSYNNYMLKDTNLSIQNNIVYSGSVVLAQETLENPLKIKVSYNTDICGNTLSISNFTLTPLALYGVKPNVVNIEQDSDDMKSIFLFLDRKAVGQVYLSSNSNTIKNNYGIYVESFNNLFITKFLDVLNINTPEQDGGKAMYIEFVENAIISGSNLDGFSVTVTKTSKSNYSSVTFDTTALLTTENRNQLKLNVLDGSVEEGDSFNISYENNGNNYITDQYGFVLSRFTFSWGNSILTNTIKSLMVYNVLITTEESNKAIVLFQKNINGPPVNVGNELNWVYNNSGKLYKAYKKTLGGSFTEINVTRVKPVISNGIRAIEFTLDRVIKYNENLGISWDSKNLTSENRITDEYQNEAFSSIYDIKNKLYGSLNLLDVNNEIDGITIKEHPDLIVLENFETLRLEIDVYFKRIVSGETISGFLNTSGGATVSDFLIKNYTTSQTFNPDFISNNENGSIRLSVDLTNNNFNETINIGDVITMQVLGDDKIYDQFNNFMLELNEFKVRNNVGYDGSVVSAQESLEDPLKIKVSYDRDICGNTLDISNFTITPLSLYSAKPNIINIEQDSQDMKNIFLFLDKQAVGQVYLSSVPNTIKNNNGIYVESFNNLFVTKFLNISNADTPDQEGGKTMYISFLDDRIISGSNLDGFSVTVVKSVKSNYNSVTFDTTASLNSENKNQLRLGVLDGLVEDGDTFNISYDNNGNNYITDQYGFALTNFTLLWDNSILTNTIKSPTVNNAFIKTQESNKIIILFQKNANGPSINVGNSDNWSYNNSDNKYKAYKRTSGGTFIEINVSFVKTVISNGIKGIEFTLDQVIKYNESLGISWNSRSLTRENRIIDEYQNEAFSSIHDAKNTLYGSLNLLDVNNEIDGITIKDNSDLIVIENMETLKLEMDVYFKRFFSGETISGFLNTSGGTVVSDFLIKNYTTNKNFYPDSISNNENGSIRLSIDLTKENFNKMINTGDVITLQVLGDDKIYDEYNNFMIELNEFNVTNNISINGSLNEINIENEEFNKIYLTFGVDLCGNTINPADFVFTPSKAIQSAVQSQINNNQIIITLENDIIENSNVTLSLRENYQLTDINGIKIKNFENQSIIINDFDITKVNVLTSKGGKSISLYVPLSRNISNSLNFDGFNVSVISNYNGNYLKENITFGTAVIGSSNNIIEIPITSGAFQSNTVYDVSYQGDGIKDQYNKSLNTFTTSPVTCENSLYKVIFRSGIVNTEAPNKIIVDFSLKRPMVAMRTNIDEINYSNEFKYYKFYIDSVESNVVSVKTIVDSGNNYLEYTISDVINYKNILGISWNYQNLPINLNDKIRTTNGLEAYSAQFDPLYNIATNMINVTNSIDGIKISSTSNVSQKSNKFEIQLNFTRLNSNSIVTPFNSTGGDIFDNTYLDDFSIVNNGVSITPDYIHKKNDSLILDVNYSLSDFSKVIDVLDVIQVEYVGNNSIVDQYSNILLNEPLVNIENNVTNIGNIYNAANTHSGKDQINMLFDIDICGNTINYQEFEINIPSNPDITIINAVKNSEKILTLFLSEEISDITNSSVSIKENYSLRTKYGIKVNRFVNIPIEDATRLEYGLRIGNGVSLYAGQDIQIEGYEYLRSNPEVDLTFNFEIQYEWKHRTLPSYNYFTDVFSYTDVIQAYPPGYIIGQDFSTYIWYKIIGILKVKKTDGTFVFVEIPGVNMLENKPPILKTPIINNYYVNVGETDNISISDIIIDPDGGDIEYHLLSSDALPNFISYSNEILTVQNPTINEIGEYTISIKGYDDKMAPNFFEFKINIINSNVSPTITSTSINNAVINSDYNSIVTANDEDGDNNNLVFELTSSPSWLEITNNNNGSATLSGTVPNNAVTSVITVKATDSNGEESSKDLTLTVTNPNISPTITSTSINTAVVNSNYNSIVTANDEDGDNNNLVFELTSSPSWLEITNNNNGSATLSGTVPNNAVTSVITVKATDTNGGEVSKDLTLTVYQPLTFTIEASNGDEPNRINTNTIDPIEDQDLLFNTIVVTGGKTDDIVVTFSTTNTIIPLETFSHTKGSRTATLNWTPQEPYTSWWNSESSGLIWTITVSDGIQTISQNYNVYVQPVNSPTTGSIILTYTGVSETDQIIEVGDGILVQSNPTDPLADDEALGPITYSLDIINSTGVVQNTRTISALSSYIVTSSDVGYKVIGNANVQDGTWTENTTDVAETQFTTEPSYLITPRFRILDRGTVISDPPLIGKSTLTYGYVDPSESTNIREIRFQWQKKLPSEGSWTNIDQTDTTDSLLPSNFLDCVDQVIRLKITYNTTGGFQDIIGYTPVTQIVQDNRPKITGIILMKASGSEITGENFYTKDQLNEITMKVTFDTNVQVVTSNNEQKPDVNIQIGGQGSEPTSTSNDTEKNNFSSQHKTSLYLENSLTNIDGIWKTTPHTELTFRMPTAENLGITNPLGLVELWGSSYHIETDPALRPGDRLLSLGLEGSHIKSYNPISNKNDIHAILTLPNLFSEIEPSVSINVFTEPSITLTAEPNNGRDTDGNIIPQESSLIQINKVGLLESYINYYHWHVTRFYVTVENTGSSNVYKIDNVRQPTLQLRKKQLYTFSQQDSSNSTHPMNFYRNSNKTESLGDNIIVAGIPSGQSAGDGEASTVITLIIKDTIDVDTIYYQCQNHPNMGGEITILNDIPDTYQITQNDVNKEIGVTINYTLPWESGSTTIYKKTSTVVDIDTAPRFISSFEDVRITEGAIYEKDFEFTDDEYFTGTNNYLKLTGKYLLDGSEITIPTYKRYNIDKNESDMIITDENGHEVGDLLLTVGVKYSFIVDQTFYNDYGFEIYKQETGTDTARETIIGYSAGANPDPHESDSTKYSINLYFSEFPESGETTLYFGSKSGMTPGLVRNGFSLQYSPIILRAGGAGLNALEYKLIAFFNKDEMDNITVDGRNNVLPVTLTVMDTPVDEGSTPQSVEATFNITVDNLDILNNTVSGTSIRANGIYENGKSEGGPLEYEMNEIFDGDYTKAAKIKIVSEADLSGKNRTTGDNYGMINIDLGRSYPIYGIRFYHRGALSANQETTQPTVPKQIQVWYSVGTLDDTYYQNDSTITVAHYTNNFQLGRANTVFNLSNEPGYKYFYFNQGIDVAGISKSENICFNSQVYTRYLHLKIIDVWEPTKQYTEIPSIDFIGPGTIGQSNYLFNSDVITFNNTVNHLQLQKQKEVILSRFVDPTEADINDYNIDIKDQAGANIITDSVISVDPTSKTIRYANENTNSSDYYKQVIIKLTPKSGGDEIVQVFAINIGSEDIVAVTGDIIPTQIKMINDNYSIDSYSFFDNPEAKPLIYSGNYKNITESNYQSITYGGNSDIYLNDTAGMTFGISSDYLGTGIYNIILHAQLDESLIRSPTIPTNFTENTTSTKRSQQFDLIVIPNTTLTLNYDQSTTKIEASINDINNINNIVDKIYKLEYTWKEKSGDDWINITGLNTTTIKGTTGEIMKFEYDAATKQVSVNEGTPSTTITDVAFDSNNSVSLSSIANKTVKLFMEVTVYDRNINCNQLNDPDGQSHYLTLSYDETSNTITKEFTEYGDSWSSRGDQRLFNRPEDRHPNLILSDSGRKFGDESNVELYVLKSELYDSGMATINCITKSQYDAKLETEKQDYEQADKEKYYAYPSIFMPYNSNWERIPQKLSIESNSIMILDLQSNLLVPDTHVGYTLSIDTSDFPTDYTYTYIWERANSNSGPYNNVVSSGTSYTLTNSDIDKFIRLKVTYDGIILTTSGIQAMAPHSMDEDTGGGDSYNTH